jgi:hypothetical protein
MNKKFPVKLLNTLAKEQRNWLIYSLKVKRHGIKTLCLDDVKPKNLEEGC